MARLTAENLTFAYPGCAPVLQNVSLQVESHERVALKAPSGYGKSTLCQLLAGYLTPQQGSVLLDGKKPQAGPGKPNAVQLIWQHPEQVMDPYLRMSESLAEVGGITEELRVGLGIKPEWLTRFPHELSGGELQRCCIARTLMCRPQFIIADEISTMLDAITQAQIWHFLLEYTQNNGVGLVMVTHSPALLQRLATRVIEL